VVKLVFTNVSERKIFGVFTHRGELTFHLTAITPATNAGFEFNLGLTSLAQPGRVNLDFTSLTWVKPGLN